MGAFIVEYGAHIAAASETILVIYTGILPTIFVVEYLCSSEISPPLPLQDHCGGLFCAWHTKGLSFSYQKGISSSLPVGIAGLPQWVSPLPSRYLYLTASLSHINHFNLLWEPGFHPGVMANCNYSHVRVPGTQHL